MRNAPPPNKKRKIKTVHEEKIDFDPAAREEYLTGFHKRKLARRKFAEDEAAKKEKEERLRFRKEVRVGEEQKHTRLHMTPAYRAARGKLAELHGRGSDSHKQNAQRNEH